MKSVPILLACVAVAHAAETERLRNDKVVAVEYAISPGESLAASAHPAVVVCLHGPDAKRGHVTFQAPGSPPTHNSGASDLRLLRIEFLRSGSDETWGKQGLAPNYQLLLENRYARVYDIRIPAGGREPQHTHKTRVVVCLSGAELKHLMPDGKEETATLKTGEIAWRGAATHIGQNLGKTDLWVIAVEPK
jgi:quercetin dioxygenase-like cupin family protein